MQESSYKYRYFNVTLIFSAAQLHMRMPIISLLSEVLIDIKNNTI